MDATDNLRSLHEHEEKLRLRSLELINGRADLSDHWEHVSEAMNAVYGFSHDHAHGSDK
jgi:hypothetical protein